MIIVTILLLANLESCNLFDYWVKEYESKKDVVDFRKSLKEKYNNIIKTKL